jgi:hypothetical protein
MPAAVGLAYGLRAGEGTRVAPSHACDVGAVPSDPRVLGATSGVTAGLAPEALECSPYEGALRGEESAKGRRMARPDRMWMKSIMRDASPTARG